MFKILQHPIVMGIAGDANKVHCVVQLLYSWQVVHRSYDIAWRAGLSATQLVVIGRQSYAHIRGPTLIVAQYLLPAGSPKVVNMSWQRKRRTHCPRFVRSMLKLLTSG
eukprot:GHRR01028416.1.p1 GENE.GHRR01028416.1~~GHRR01028416.1.p1  ORF type:complete len:108 (+),score=7.29 GHRR01028416.1:436-759(+)